MSQIYIAHVKALPGCTVGQYASFLEAALDCFLKGYRIHMVQIEQVELDTVASELFCRPKTTFEAFDIYYLHLQKEMIYDPKHQNKEGEN